MKKQESFEEDYKRVSDFLIKIEKVIFELKELQNEIIDIKTQRARQYIKLLKVL